MHGFSVLMLVALLPAGAASDAFVDPFADPITYAAVLDREAVTPGSTFRVAVVMTIEEGWHAYGNPKGEGTGKETELAVKDAAGFTFGPARYVPGKRKSQEDIAPGDWVYAYDGAVPIFMEGTASADMAPGTYTVTFAVDALACKQSCVPSGGEVKLAVNVVAGGEAPRPANAPIFAVFDQAQAPGSGAAAAYETVEDSLQVRGLLWAILFGFVAGIILNVMPCVLPVLGIKIMSLVSQAREEPGRVFRLGLAFGAGVMAVFLTLAILAAFSGASWGDHFQSETFLVVMLCTVFVFALGLFDVYIMLVPGGVEAAGAREGYLGSFLKGILATFLATPCSGPLLGATLAWALTQPPAIIFAVFTSIGLGMAAPYVLLAASPRLMRYVPKPGAWMETFKHHMGFVLLATVVFLGSLMREELLKQTLAYCLLLAFGAYLWGRYAHGAVPMARRWAWRAVLAMIAAGTAYACFQPSKPDVWEPYSRAAFEGYQEAGQTVVIDFTADWCLNCKYVEKFVLESEAVQGAFKAKEAALLKADLTRRDPTSDAEKLRTELGSRSIPFLAIFPGNDPRKARVLRDIYTQADVLAILDECPTPGGETTQ
jgi:thiol:disulfide interchange protein DsbD